MRGLNRDGRPLFHNREELIGLPGGALAQFDFRLSSLSASPGVPPYEAGVTDLWTGFRPEAALSQFEMASAGGPGLPDNHQPVEAAWYIPGPTALIDVYTPNPNTTGTLVV